ncbi:MAG: hypothetical protein ACM3XO_18160 [Bacteroidota bacterium]
MDSLRKILSIAILLPLLLSACGPSLPPQPTITPISLPATWTPLPMATGRPVATELPTFTPVPAFTPISTPTADSLAALSERFQNSLFSPNGRWTAYRDPDKLRVVNNDDPLRTWTLPCALFKDCSTVYPVKWSRNGQDLYFAPAPTTGGAPMGLALVSALAKINMRTGKWENLLPDSNRNYDFAFSPEDEYLAYTQSSGSQSDEKTVTVGVVNMEDTRIRQEFTMDGVYAGNIVWSPFKPRFVFVIYDPEQGSAVGYYDVETGYLKYALETRPADILISDWGPDNLVSLEKKDWDTNKKTYRILNPFTGELIGDPATATP